MVTQEQADRYGVQAINTDDRVAMSYGGDIGEIVGFYDADGDGCELSDAVFALVHWADVDLWTSVPLYDYQSTKLH